MGQLKATFGILILGLFLSNPQSWAGGPGTALAGTQSENPTLQGQYPDLGLTLIQFIDHVENHITRVKKLALVALNKFGSLYEGITPELAEEFLSLHDKSKINTTPEFYAEVNYHNELSIPERLRRTFGKALDAQGNLKPEARALFAEFNKMDDLVRYQFFKRHGMLYRDGTLKPIAVRLLTLEKVSDEVDRVAHPISEFEFGRPMVRVGFYSPSEGEVSSFYITLDDAQIAVARFLEKKFEATSEGHFFPQTFTIQQCIDIMSHTQYGSTD